LLTEIAKDASALRPSCTNYVKSIVVIEGHEEEITG